MDSLLGSLFGDQDSDSKKNQAQDFINRYEQGAPHEGISAEEAVTNYQAVAGQLSPQDLEDSATEAYEKLSPEERNQFAQWLKEQGGDQIGDINADDPRQLAQVTSRVQQNQPDGLAGLLGGGGGGIGSLLGGALGGSSSGKSSGGLGGMLSGALGGGQGQSQNQGGGMGDIMQNPIARAVFGGIAAIAMKKVMNR
ncbi:MAG: hypothetical protein WKF81_02150 [Thermomicrobiales bacterium]